MASRGRRRPVPSKSTSYSTFLLAAFAAVGSGLAPAASGPEAPVVIALGRFLGPAEAASKAVDPADSESIQAAYDTARDLQEGLRVPGVGTSACEALRAAGLDYAVGRIAQQDGLDRPDDSIRRAGTVKATAALGRLASLKGTCQTAPTTSNTSLTMTPGSGEAFFGTVAASAPNGTSRAELTVDGGSPQPVSVSANRVRVSVLAAPGRHDLTLTFLSGSQTLGQARASGTWLLPLSARTAHPYRTRDPKLEQRLSALGRSVPGYSAFWVQNLTDGRGAGTNAGARFPAASTVKLGLLVGAIAKLGPSPQTSPYFADLQAMAGWSSNLATNRLVDRLGSGCGTGADALAADGLRRLGSRASTFTGCYIVGTELQPEMPDAPATSAPPLDTRRYTTAQDLGRMLFAIHASAVGAPGARRQTGLTQGQARLALGLLLASQQVGDNQSLFLGGLPTGTPVAQKNGWLRRSRLGASVIYGPQGPTIAVMAAHNESGLSLAQAASIGARLARIAVRT